MHKSTIRVFKYHDHWGVLIGDQYIFLDQETMEEDLLRLIKVAGLTAIQEVGELAKEKLNNV